MFAWKKKTKGGKEEGGVAHITELCYDWSRMSVSTNSEMASLSIYISIVKYAPVLATDTEREKKRRSILIVT